jgi:3-hydroxyacyl-[acyl-carrier protein] dehydratase/trans-2-decenoyl-[acyl-carrier protein] isomerase
VFPTAKKVTYELQIKRVIGHRLTMAIANGSVFVDGERIYEAKDLKTVMTVSA